VNTKAGNKLAPAYAQMKQIVKNRPRKSRKTKAASVPAPAPVQPEKPSVPPSA
jgi:hypothetical protein